MTPEFGPPTNFQISRLFASSRNLRGNKLAPFGFARLIGPTFRYAHAGKVVAQTDSSEITQHVRVRGGKTCKEGIFAPKPLRQSLSGRRDARPFPKLLFFNLLRFCYFPGIDLTPTTNRRHPGAHTVDCYLTHRACSLPNWHSLYAVPSDPLRCASN